MDIVEACLVLHNFVRERDNYNFENAMTMTGLEDVRDGQSKRWGVNRGQCTESSARLFSNRCWRCSLANVKNMSSTALKMREDKFVRISVSCVQ